MKILKNKSGEGMETLIKILVWVVFFAIAIAGAIYLLRNVTTW